MTDLFQACAELAGIYRERDHGLGFWAEPFNAISNTSFLIATAFAFALGIRRRVTERWAIVLMVLSAMIGYGSFFFHTIPNRYSMWLDIGPIASYQVIYLWLVLNHMLAMRRWISAGIVLGIVGTSFVLFPFHQPLNGSLFYLPSLLAMVILGGMWSCRVSDERFLLLAAAGCFAVAVAARTVDWTVPWPIGTHFLWHLINGGVVYLTLRAWILFVAARQGGGTHEVTFEGYATIADRRSIQGR